LDRPSLTLQDKELDCPQIPKHLRELKAKAFRIFYESFVWMKEDGTVDIAMLMLNDDEALLDAMTEFLLAELEKNEDKYGQTAKQSRRRGLLLARQ
jgi:hypothetical protein